MIIKINTKYLLTFIKNIKNKGLVAYGAQDVVMEYILIRI